MNGFRQLAPSQDTLLRDLAAVVEELDTRIVHAFDLLKLLDARLVEVAQTTLAAIDDERRSVGQLQQQTTLRTDSTVWQRLRWIATGR
jgi:hypothetical protein